MMRARRAKPRAFGHRNKNGSETKEVKSLITFVAEKKLVGKVTGPTFLAARIVVIGGFVCNWTMDIWFWSFSSASQ